MFPKVYLHVITWDMLEKVICQWLDVPKSLLKCLNLGYVRKSYLPYSRIFPNTSLNIKTYGI